jgi:hypothetical protein
MLSSTATQKLERLGLSNLSIGVCLWLVLAGLFMQYLNSGS